VGERVEILSTEVIWARKWLREHF